MRHVWNHRWLWVGLAVLLAGCGELWVPGTHASASFALNCNHSDLACESCHAPGTDPKLTDPACLSCHEENRPQSHDPTETATCDDCHTGCGWDADIEAHPVSCNHTNVACESCHPAGSDATQTDPACLSCHEQDRPTSHDPETTVTCNGCHSGCGWDAVSGFHPDGFITGDQHGQAMKLQDAVVGDCRVCHGDELTGGDAIGCDECHTATIPGWRTDCVLCHGGELDNTGAPPLDIDDTSDVNAISAPSHPAHATPDTHAEIPCTSCHETVVRALDIGHIFDATPARAEVSLVNALGGGSYDGNGTCSSSYCHGNGRTDGSVSEGDTVTCESCHQGPNSGSWGGMSGEHDRHMGANARCNDCHSAVVGSNNTIISGPLHVNGTVDVSMESSTGLSWNGTTCSGGGCHGQEHPHNGDSWTEN